MRYTESHEWVLCKGNIATIGITPYAQKELGEIVYVELPPLGKIVRAKEEMCVLESTKAAVDIYAPVSGKVVAVNDLLKKTPTLINQKAEKEGWLFQIECANLKELDSLMSEKEYRSLVG